MALDNFTQIYSNYDKAVKAFAGSLRYNNRPIVNVFASPERVFNQVEISLNKQRRKKGIPEESLTVIPLPVLSVSLVGEAYDMSRSRYATWQVMYTNTDRDTIYGMQYPQPLTLTYQVDIWTRTKEDLDILGVQFMQKFTTNFTYLTVDHVFPMGERLVMVRLSNINIDIATDTLGEKKVVRKSYTIEVDAWIVPPVLEAGNIQNIQADIYDITEPDSPVLIDEIVVTDDD